MFLLIPMHLNKSNISVHDEVELFIVRLIYVNFSDLILLFMLISLRPLCSISLIIALLAILFTFPFQRNSQIILFVFFITFPSVSNAASG